MASTRKVLLLSLVLILVVVAFIGFISVARYEGGYRRGLDQAPTVALAA